MNQAIIDDIGLYIPLDKSWLMRLGLLDLIHDKKDTVQFLASQKDCLGSDLQALKKASEEWLSGQKGIHVGESGTLYRFMQFAAWKQGRQIDFILEGTLKRRKITKDPQVIHLSIKDLLKLDGGTSQWASAAVLLGNTEHVSDPLPYKYKLTLEAVNHWEKQHQLGQAWQPRLDTTIERQAKAYLLYKRTGVIEFKPEQAEDYCFARAFGLITAQQGEKKWPSLRQHESDRIAEMERALKQKNCDSRDHRVVQAIAMLKDPGVEVLHTNCVYKSWPSFWDFLAAVN